MDRNNGRLRAVQNTEMSLSARRAWIEIALAPKQNPTQKVALRKESVDRNPTIIRMGEAMNGRSPQGERG